MTPLKIIAHLSHGLRVPQGWLALDAVLAWAVARREGLPPIDVGGYQPVEIPVQREPENRFHLASFFIPDIEIWERQYTNRRPVIAEAQLLGGPRFRRLDMATGPNKAYRIPREIGIPRGGKVEAYCIGDREKIIALLSWVTHLGKQTSVGHGEVIEWEVLPCESWQGFPVVKEGKPLRRLPPDWPGLEEPFAREYGTLSYPYWYARESKTEVATVDVSYV